MMQKTTRLLFFVNALSLGLSYGFVSDDALGFFEVVMAEDALASCRIASAWLMGREER